MEKKATYKHFDFQGNEQNHKASVSDEKAVHMTDLQIWQEFQSGSDSAFANIYKSHATLLYSYGLKLVYDKELVKDAIQDLFIELWDSKDRLSKVKSIKAYLYKSLRRKLISKVIKERKTFDKNQDLTSLDAEIPSTEISLIEKQQFDAKRKTLEKAIASLSNKQREIIHLKFYGRLSYLEISEIMALDKKGTYNLMARTIQILKDHLVSIMLLIVLFSVL
ncbi:RNA polymerase sigma factor [Flavivirga sp. 57AJ16]|uniref:RNA polymerase sigma factor n=1 Tax=Flavivirga sp. 57AJ16 TaxID=3025307 RepID=UPI0023655786|nr:sigma-70 family RNA polymerase sigma factor [Flavivirga sp. 57AJ16]MDD7886795.1 sigma-70 family RNA polymerase sigma factor [Flavivirga sp. 57AJ16]